MRKIISLAVCTVLVILLLMLTLLTANQSRVEPYVSTPSQNEQVYSTANPSSSQGSSDVTAMAGEAEAYVVREFEGHIGVFQGGSDKPMQEVEVEVSSLPKADQLLLAGGIKVTGEKQLKSILEDYES